MNTRSARRWAVGTALVTVLPVLCCGGAFAYAKHSEAECDRLVATSGMTVRTDSEPIRAELRPLGTPAELHWVLDTNRACGIMPIPGSDHTDRQTGIVRLDPAAVNDLLDRFAGWMPRPVDGSDFPAALSPYVPAGSAWQHSSQLDARFVARRQGETAWYYVDAVHGLVLFSSHADY